MTNNLENNRNNLENNRNGLEIKLSTEQEKNFKNFLENKEKAEARKYSQEEINNLRKEFSEKQNENSDYIKNSSELLTGTKLEKNFGNKENFEKFTGTIDKGVYAYFFGGNGILKNLNISENEKNSFSASASVFLMNSIYEEVEKSGNFGKIQEELTKILGGKGEAGDLMNLGNSLNNFDSSKVSEIIGTIKDLLAGDIVKVFAKVYDKEKMNLISESLNEANLENNQIFSNPKETFNFFENIFKNNLDKNAIKNLINSKNSNIPVIGNKNDLKNIGDKLGNLMNPEIGNALGKVGDIADFFGKTKENIKNSITGNKEIFQVLGMLTSVPVIGEFLKMIFDFLGIDLEEINSGLKEKTEKIKQNLSSKESFLEGIKFNEKFAKNPDGKYDSNFINSIISISGNKDEKELDKDLENLFKKGGDFEFFIKSSDLKKIPNFGEKNIFKNNNGEIIFENFKYLTSLYKEFLENKKSGEINSINDFVNKKAEGDKNLNNKIFAGTESNTNEENNQENQNTENPQNQENKGNNENDQQQNIENNDSKNPQEKQIQLGTAPFVTAGVASAIAQNNEQKNKTETNNQNKQTQKEITNNNQVKTENTTKNEPKKLINTDKTQKVEQKPKENKDLIINGSEGIEINNERARYIFNLNGKKYEISTWNNGYITLIEDKNKKIVYNGGQELFKFLSKFNGRLENEAKAYDFGKNIPLSLGKSIKEVLIDGSHGEKGLKQIIPEKFFNNGQIIEGNISLKFGDNNYNLSLAQRK